MKKLVVITMLAVVYIVCFVGGTAADNEGIVGTCGKPVTKSTSIRTASKPVATASITAIVPASPTNVQNCVPFGDNISYGFTGFIYRNVPAFNLTPGTKISFDLGDTNNEDTRRNIYFAVANINPGPPIHDGSNITTSQGIMALGWTQVVSDTQIPLNPKGNLVSGDYELTYTAEASFSFPGGGLIVGVGSSPPGAYADPGCEQVLVCTDASDASGYFYSRFYYKPDQTLGVLDDITSGGSAVALGGIIIGPTTALLADWGDAPDPTFPTLPASNGPCHLEPVTIWLGNKVDAEPGPKLVDLETTDDGVKFLGSGPAGGPYTMPFGSGPQGAVDVTVTNNRPVAVTVGVSGWIDWTHDGDWNDICPLGYPIGENIFCNVPVVVPANSQVTQRITFYSPDLIYGDTWARFRVHDTAQCNQLTGTVEDGEVEDYFLKDGQLPVELSTFTANVSDGKVTLRWSTQSEVDNLGFHIYRSATKSGTYDRITTDLISGAGNSTSMHIYSFTDLNVVEGVRYWYKLEDVAFDGSTKMHSPISTRSEEENLSRSMPGSFALLQNRPNPFNPSTTIAYDLPEATEVTLTVYSLSGQKVMTLVSGYQESGHYEVMWNGQDGKGQAVSSGVYLYRLEAGKQGFVESKRMLLVR